MGQAINYIALAIPFFFLFIGIELLVGRLKKVELYRFHDAVTNLNCGIGQQVIGVFLKTVTVLLYVYCYENHRFFTIETSPVSWVILFIGVDFFYYWFHRLAHEISILWGSHVVHHQSEEYNLTVALRQAWAQTVFSAGFYLPLAFIGFNPVAFVTINSFQTLYQFWIHTKAINKMPTWFEYILNTPSHHRVHHGVNPKYIDRNHGGTLIIFDRIFGTFQAEEEEVVYGITAQPHSWNPLWLNIEYWADMLNNTWKANTWRGKLGILFNHPGWKPEELGGNMPLKEVSPRTFQKYDTTIPLGLNLYVFGQHVVTLFATSVFLFRYENWPVLWRVMIASLILATLINTGGVLETRRWVFVAEIGRLMAVIAFCIWISINTALFMPVLVVSLLYISASLFALYKYWPQKSN